jgi:hypothetical protein
LRAFLSALIQRREELVPGYKLLLDPVSAKGREPETKLSSLCGTGGDSAARLAAK